ncbi:hypothetical protein D3C71_920660 [compost metagenome]
MPSAAAPTKAGMITNVTFKLRSMSQPASRVPTKFATPNPSRISARPSALICPRLSKVGRMYVKSAY